MRTFVVIPAAIVGFALMSAGASAQSANSAKPANPSGFGQQDVKPSAQSPSLHPLGQAVSGIATQSPNQGFSPTIQQTRANFGSTPNPPGQP